MNDQKKLKVREIDVIANRSGHVRQAKVLTAKRVYTRPAVKMAALEITKEASKITYEGSIKSLEPF